MFNKTQANQLREAYRRKYPCFPSSTKSGKESALARTSSDLPCNPHSPCLHTLKAKNYTVMGSHRQRFSVWAKDMLTAAFLHKAIQRYPKGLGGMQRKSFYRTPHLFYMTKKESFSFRSQKASQMTWHSLSFMPNNMSCLCSIRSEIRGFSRAHKLAAGPKILSGCCKRVARILNSKMWSQF